MPACGSLWQPIISLASPLVRGCVAAQAHASDPVHHTPATASVHSARPPGGQARASDLMTRTLHSCSPNDTMDSALELMSRLKKRAMPVLAEDGLLLGYLKYRDPIRAAQAGKGQQHVKAWVRRELISIAPDANFATMEALLLEGGAACHHK